MVCARSNGCLGALALLALLSACTSGSGTDQRRAREAGEGRGERGEPEKEELKRGSGLSQAGSVSAGGPVSPSPLSLGVDLDRLWSDSDDWEPAIAADRSSPHVYQMTTRLDPDSAKVILRSSSDGGDTWSTDRQLYAGPRDQYDPQLAVSADGTVFAAWLETPGWETLVARSFDHGVTWSAPVVIESTLPWTDHGWLAVSDDGRDVYVAFNKADSYVVASHDGGASFGPPVRTNHTPPHTWLATGGAVGPDGTVYFGVAEYSDRYNGRTRVHVLRSGDGGQSFTSKLLDFSLAAPICNWSPGCYWGFFSPTTGVAVDQAGTVVFVYNAGKLFAQPQQIYARTSLDGIDWSAPILISHGNKFANNAFPAVVAGPGAGDFSVVWQGDHSGDTAAWNTWLRRTTDSGRTWGPSVRLSTRPDGAPYKTSKGYAFPYGDYLNVTGDGNGRVHAIWGAGQSYNGPGGTWYTRAN